MNEIIPIWKPANCTSFDVVKNIRNQIRVKVGHAGTLDPFATGVLVVLVGINYTKKSAFFMNTNKTYLATIYLGVKTDTYDLKGKILEKNTTIPTNEDISKTLNYFQGTIHQIPPMYSAKKVNGKKLYELARQGIEIERLAVEVSIQTILINYNYPFLEVEVSCSKGTYIRSLAHDLGLKLGCGAHLHALRRIKSGYFSINDCISDDYLFNKELPIPHLKTNLPCNFSEI